MICMQNLRMKIFWVPLWLHALSLNQNEQHPFHKKMKELQSKIQITQGADTRSLFKLIENQNRKQNNELQGEIEAEENSIIVID